MKKGIIIVVAVVLLAMAVLAVVGLSMLWGIASEGRVASKTLLEVDFEKGIVEYRPADPFGQMFLQEVPQILDLVEALEVGASDDRVVGLVATIGSGGLGLAQIQEIRAAVERFGASGKPTVAFSETFGEATNGSFGYYLASAFQEIYLQPSGDVNLTGVMLEPFFVREGLEKLGVEPRFGQRYEYKNAANTFIENGFTPPHREAMQRMVDVLVGQMATDMAASRGKSEEEMQALLADGPFVAQEALEQGLVDDLLYRDQVYARVLEKVEGEPDLLYLHKYLDKAGRPNDSGKGVALIYGVGGISRGPSQFSPLTGSMVMGSETVSAAFREAIEDDDIEAILFRIDCNGGSYVASDTVWREVVRAKEAGKPVIASLSNVAASGGFFVVMNADKIVAQPATITGSIGVFGGKMVTEEMWKKIGVHFESVQSSDNARMWSGVQHYTEESWERYEGWLDRIYEDFTSKVADGRGLPLERVQEIARGRVWMGEDALDLGLVDALGGYDVALGLVRESLGAAPDAGLDLKVFPRPRSPFEDLFSEGPDRGRWAAVLAGVLAEVRPVVRLAEQMGMLDGEADRVLALPEEWVPQP